MRYYWGAAAVLALLYIFAPQVAQSGQAGQNEANSLTARAVFNLLPVSIFENTAEGLSEADKQQLLANGQTEFWEVAGETEDVMVFTALPFRDSSVALRLFRHSTDGSVQAAVGTLGSPLCTMELWRVDVSGRIVPVDTPDEPTIAEFLAKGQKLPPEINPAVLICLGQGGLRAQALFWNSSGMAYVPLTNDINWQWRNNRFEKQVEPHKEGADRP